MNKALLQSKLQFLDEQNVGLELYFLYKKEANEPFTLLRAHLDGTTVLAKLESLFISKIRQQFLGKDISGKILKDSPQWNLKHIKDVDDIKDNYYYFPNIISENEEYHIPEEFERMSQLKSKAYEEISLFEFDSHILDFVHAYLIRLQIDSEQVILYKHKYPIETLSRATILKVFNINHDTKFSLETDPLLKINDKIDFMFIDNNYIILSLSLLESKYGFNDRYLKQASESLNFLKSKNILKDTKILEQQSLKVSFSKKLMKIKSDNPVLKVPIQEMNKFLINYKSKDGKHSLSKRIKYIAKTNKFEIATIVAAEDFIKLLNDEFLISQLTKKPYVSPNKTEFE
jgi:hypothetical protein